MTTRRGVLRFGLGAAGIAVLGEFSQVRAAAQAGAAELITKGADFLKSRQAADGSWSGERNEPGITALVVTALLRSKRVTPDDPMITKALTYLEPYLGPEGGMSKAPHSVYSTSVALMAFQEANKSGKYDAVIKGSQDYLKTSQYDEGEGKGPDDPQYGGLGYGGGNSRPDLSNTSFMMEALHDTGIPPDDPAMKKALIFVSRCQNLKSEFNDQPWADKIDDGGFIYTPANGGTSVAGKAPDGVGLLSYGSMTYAGYKSLIYAGLTADDPRVKAALDYIKKNYTVDENPGLGDSGLYYYYQVFAKVMNSLGSPTFTDAEGKARDWRADLINAIAKRQNAEGAWVNSSDRFMEGDPNLVTAYVLIALANARHFKSA